jgi:adenosine deaminase
LAATHAAEKVRVEGQQLDLPGVSAGISAVNSDTEVRARILTFDKGELHVHLNGALPIATVQEILADEATDAPVGFDLKRDLVRRSACTSLAEYLTPWQILRRFPKRRENLQRQADAALGSLAKHGVRFVELRSSVLYLASLQKCKPADALERLIVVTEAAAAARGMRRGLIMTVTRGDYSAVNLATLLQAFEDLGEPSDVVGIDLAGNEEVPYPAELPMLFQDAKARYGLGVTIHAGETGRIENVLSAVDLFGADRIGHGTAAGRYPRVMDLLAERDICVEVCPISNRMTGSVPPNEAHPLRVFQRAGVPFVICSDNPEIHQQGLSDDFLVAMAEGLSEDDLRQQYSLARRYSFIRELK